MTRADDKAIADAEYRRDHGDSDDWQTGQDRYERHLDRQAGQP